MMPNFKLNFLNQMIQERLAMVLSVLYKRPIKISELWRKFKKKKKTIFVSKNDDKKKNVNKTDFTNHLI